MDTLTLDQAAPLLIGAGQMAVVASTLAYTAKSSPLRLATLALIGGFGYWHYWSCPGLSTSGLWNGTCAATNIIYCQVLGFATRWVARG